MMFKKLLRLIFFTILSLLLFACSSDNSESTSESGHKDTADSVTMEVEKSQEFSNEDSRVENVGSEEQAETQVNEELPEGTDPNRKIIYNANLNVEVKNFQDSVSQIERDIIAKNGYIVSSDAYQVEDDLQEGTITARIPQEQFESFLAIMEQGDMKVTQKSVSGEDVTEQYVDLESRLKSKKLVEERLLEFMEQAEKTEDLLNISNDLAKVQEEIEQITGKLNYLENKSDLATITIHINENRVDIVKDEDLNTWEKTKEQLKKSINFLLSAGSGLIIFILGNTPVIAILVVIGIFGYRYWRKRMKQEKQ